VAVLAVVAQVVQLLLVYLAALVVEAVAVGQHLRHLAEMPHKAQVVVEQVMETKAETTVRFHLILVLEEAVQVLLVLLVVLAVLLLEVLV
jgi:hypothetical protein